MLKLVQCKQTLDVQRDAHFLSGMTHKSCARVMLLEVLQGNHHHTFGSAKSTSRILPIEQENLAGLSLQDTGLGTYNACSPIAGAARRYWHPMYQTHPHGSSAHRSRAQSALQITIQRCHKSCRNLVHKPTNWQPCSDTRGKTCRSYMTSADSTGCCSSTCES